MHVTIVKLSQDLDLESGVLRNYVMLRLPGGDAVRAEISDASAEAIVAQVARMVPTEEAHEAAPRPLVVSSRPIVSAQFEHGPTGEPHVVNDEMGYPVADTRIATDEDGAQQL